MKMVNHDLQSRLLHLSIIGTPSKGIHKQRKVSAEENVILTFEQPHKGFKRLDIKHKNKCFTKPVP